MKFFYFLMSLSRKKWLIILLVFWGIGVGGWYGYRTFFVNEENGDDYISNDMQVTRGDIINSLMMNGRAKFSNMQKLMFPHTGRITAVYKKVWDMVQAGDIIAKMDTYEVDNDLEQARISLENEQRALEKTLNTSQKELNVLQAEKEYQTLLYEWKNADISLQLALQTIENDYINKKNDYLQAVRDYDKKVKDFETLQKIYEEILSLDKSDMILHSDEVLKEKVDDLKYTVDGVKRELDALDKLMIYTTKYGTQKPDYYIYIGAKDASTKNQVERLFWDIHSMTTTIYNWANALQVASISEVELKSTLIQYYEELKLLADKKTLLSESAEKMFDASVETSDFSWGSVSISDGRSLKTQANASMDEILGLVSPKTIGEKKKAELEDLALELEKNKQALERLKIEYDQLDTEKVKKIMDVKIEYEMKELEVKIVKANLDELKQGDNEEVRLIKNRIKQQEKQIETILKRYDEYTLKANFDGVITKMNLQVGDTIGNQNSSSDAGDKYVYIENPDNLEIELDVDQSDIVKILVGMPVQIILDALPMSPYTGVLLEIDTTAGDDMGGWYYGGGTTYKAKVVFTKKPEDTILWAMTAGVTIILDEEYDVLMIPNMAVSYGNEGPMVMKVEKGKYKKVPVELWISDQANVEVLGGLEEWDVIMGVFIDKEGMDAAGLNEEQMDPWMKEEMVMRW